MIQTISACWTHQIVIIDWTRQAALNFSMIDPRAHWFCLSFLSLLPDEQPLQMHHRNSCCTFRKCCQTRLVQEMATHKNTCSISGWV